MVQSENISFKEMIGRKNGASKISSTTLKGMLRETPSKQKGMVTDMAKETLDAMVAVTKDAMNLE